MRDWLLDSVQTHLPACLPTKWSIVGERHIKSRLILMLTTVCKRVEQVVRLREDGAASARSQLLEQGLGPPEASES